MDWEEVDGTLDPTYQQMLPGNVIPGAGSTVGAAATGSQRRMLTAVGSGPGAATAMNPSSVGPQGNFVIGLVTFIVFAAIIMFAAHRFGEEGEFKNIKASAYNILFVSIVAVAGIPVWKAAFQFLASLNVPLMKDANTWAQAA